MASLEGDDLVPVIFYNLRASKKSGLIRRVTFGVRVMVLIATVSNSRVNLTVYNKGK
jgi:hypothetical protein